MAQYSLSQPDIHTILPLPRTISQPSNHPDIILAHPRPRRSVTPQFLGSPHWSTRKPTYPRLVKQGTVGGGASSSSPSLWDHVRNSPALMEAGSVTAVVEQNPTDSVLRHRSPRRGFVGSSKSQPQAPLSRPRKVVRFLPVFSTPIVPSSTPIVPSVEPSPAPPIDLPSQHPFAHVRRISETSVHDIDHASVIRQLLKDDPPSESDFSSVTLSTSDPELDSEPSPPPSGYITEANLSMYLRTLESWKEISLGGMSTRSSPSQEPVALPKPFTKKEGMKETARKRKGRRLVVLPHRDESTPSESREPTPETFSHQSFFDSSTSPTGSALTSTSKTTRRPLTAAPQTSDTELEIHHRTIPPDEGITLHPQHWKRLAEIQQFRLQEQRETSMKRPQGTDEKIERSPIMSYGSQLFNPPDAIMRGLIAELSEFRIGTSPMLSSRRWIEENRNTIYTIMRNAIGFNYQDPAYLSSIILEIKLYPVRYSILIALPVANDIFFSV